MIVSLEQQENSGIFALAFVHMKYEKREILLEGMKTTLADGLLNVRLIAFKGYLTHIYSVLLYLYRYA